MTSLPPPSELPSLLAATQRRLDDIKTFQLPRLAGVTSLGLHADLCQECREDLASADYNLQVCRELAFASHAGGAASTTLQQLDLLQGSLSSLRQEYRATALASKRSMAARRRLGTEERYELDTARLGEGSAGPADPGRAPGPVDMGEDQLQSKTNEVTDALRRTAQLMQTELERSVLSVQMLDSSTQSLRSTAGLYDTYTHVLSASSALVRHLEKADWWDRLFLAIALLFFLLCVAFVLKRRVLDKAARGVGWWVGGSFTLLRKGSRALGVGSGSGSAASDVVAAAGPAKARLGKAAVGLAGSAGAAGIVWAEKMAKDVRKEIGRAEFQRLLTASSSAHSPPAPAADIKSAVGPSVDGGTPPRDEL